jgi:hypothetical protein
VKREEEKAEMKEMEGGRVLVRWVEVSWRGRAKTRVEDTIVVGWEKALAGKLLARWVFLKL